MKSTSVKTHATIRNLVFLMMATNRTEDLIYHKHVSLMKIQLEYGIEAYDRGYHV